MGAGDVREVDLPHDPHAERGKPPPCPVEVPQVEQGHIAAVASGALELARGRRTLGQRRDDLEEAVADREDDVREAELADAGVAERLTEPEPVTQRLGDRLEVAGYEDRLAQPDPRVPLVHARRLPGGRR
jgi:hypothetical protein